MPSRRVTSLFAALAALMIAGSAQAAQALKPVPFVSCAQDGQVGPEPGPKAPQAPVLAPARVAGRLAYYASSYSGVLAPRGWHCFGLYGSNGSSLIVTPEPHGQDLFGKGPGLLGPAIQLSVSIGDTSGRFEAAEVAARLFPARRAFVQSVIAEGLEPASNFPMGPFPTDRLTRRSPTLVEFETPGGAAGMGAKSRLTPNRNPIAGFAAITDDNSVIQLSVRLPAGLRGLVPAIIADAESRNPRAAP